MKFKKIVAGVIAATTILSVMTFAETGNNLPGMRFTSSSVSAATTTNVTLDHINYSLYTDTNGKKCASVVGYDKTVTSIKVPATITSGSTSYTVTEIADCAFLKSKLTYVELYKATGITKIGDSAFQSSDSLISINLPPSMTSLGSMAFYNCKKLKTVNFWSNKVMTKMSGCVFANCISLTGVTLPENLKRIESSTFIECESLPYIKIPAATTSIGSAAFQNCKKLSTVVFGNTSGAMKIEEGAFKNCSSIGSLTLPGGTTSIGNSAFYNCTSFTTANIPSTVTDIGDDAFYNCKKWNARIELGNKLKTIGTCAFTNCSQLISVKMTNSVTSVGGGVFGGCENLQNVTLSSALTKLPKCTYTKFGDGLGFFEGCRSLLKVVLPPSCEVVDEQTFLGCENMCCVEITNGTYMKVVDNILYTKDGKTLLYYVPGKSQSSFSVPVSVKVRNYAFDSVRFLSKLNFNGFMNGLSVYHCKQLTDITMPNGCYDTNITNFMKNYGEIIKNNYYIQRINNNLLVNAPKDGSAVPTFPSKFKSEFETNFEEYDECWMMKEYVRAYSKYIVKTQTESSDCDLEKAKKLHDWLCKHVCYDGEDIYNDKNHVEAAAFLHKKSDGKYYCVCNSYAYAYLALMQSAGIEAYRVVGGNDKKLDSNAGHAWNIIKLGGNYYHVDCCWDDGDTPGYGNFLKSDKEFLDNGHSDFMPLKAYKRGGTLVNTPIPPRSTSVIGDINKDGTVNDADILLLNKYILEDITFNEDQMYAGDITMDGKITAADLVGIRQVASYRSVCGTEPVFNYYLAHGGLD